MSLARPWGVPCRLLLCLAGAGLLWAEAVRAEDWSVIEGDRQQVKVRREFDDGLLIGDRMEIYFIVEGLNQAARKATGRVIQAGADDFIVRLEADSVTGTPQPGDRVRLVSGAPRGTSKPVKAEGLSAGVKELLDDVTVRQYTEFRMPRTWKLYRNVVPVMTTRDWMTYRKKGTATCQLSYCLTMHFQQNNHGFERLDPGETGAVRLESIRVVELGPGEEPFAGSDERPERRAVFGRQIYWLSHPGNERRGEQVLTMAIQQGSYGIVFRFVVNQHDKTQEFIASDLLTIVSSALVY